MVQNYNTGISLNSKVLASKGQRFVNFIVDMIIRYVIAFCIGLIGGTISTLLGYDNFLLWMANAGLAEELVFSVSILLLYFFIMEGLTQRTLGKYITGTKVIMGDGSKPGASVIFIRSLCRFIPFDVFSFLGDRPVGWHDSLSKTFVVDAKKYEAELRMKNTIDEIGKEII